MEWDGERSGSPCPPRVWEGLGLGPLGGWWALKADYLACPSGSLGRPVNSPSPRGVSRCSDPSEGFYPREVEPLCPGHTTTRMPAGKSYWEVLPHFPRRHQTWGGNTLPVHMTLWCSQFPEGMGWPGQW